MNIKECYEAFDGDYEDVLRRLSLERIVKKFLLKFADDKSYELLVTSLEEGNTEEAFRAAHTIKGICLNLGFTKLKVSSEAVTEALRGGDIAAAKELFPALKNDYDTMMEAIKKLDD